MKRMIWLGSLVGIVSITARAQPGTSPAQVWENWLYIRALTLDETEQPRLVQLSLPMEVYGRAQDTLADLRIVDEDDEEVPFILHVQRRRSTQNWLSGRLTEVSFVPGEYTLVVIDTGTDASLHNRLEIHTEETDFFARAELAVSDDGRNWRLVRQSAPIYRFESTDDEAVEISYSETRARWLRLRILHGEKQVHVANCRISREVVQDVELSPLPRRMVRVEPEPTSAGRESRWQVDLGVERVPVSAVHFEAEQPEFHRSVRVLRSADGSNWTEVGRGTVYRFTASETGEVGDERDASSMTVSFTERRGRYWQVVVVDGNDTPVEGLVPTLQSTPRKVILQQQPGHEYRLVYGNTRAIRPRYDLEQLISRNEIASAAPGGLGAEEENAGYVSAEPWTEQHPAVLWVALVVAVAALGLIAIRSLR